MPLDASLDELVELARHPEGLAVICDLDGTLAHIIPRPEDVELVEGARETLAELAALAGLVAFVSGRGIHDLMRIVGLPELTYAGNHGMEFRHPGRDPAPAPEAAAHVARLAAFRDEWRERLCAEGIRIEDKGVTLSLHYRAAPHPVAAEAFLRAVVDPAAVAAGLNPTPGRKVLEIRPPVRLDKGTAVRDMLAGGTLRRAVYLGDDNTDLDAWRELRRLEADGALDRALTVGVAGDEVPALVEEADVVVDGPDGALAALRALVTGARGARADRPGA